MSASSIENPSNQSLLSRALELEYESPTWKELEQRSQQLKVVNAIARIVSRSPEVNDFLEQALQQLLTFMELDAGAVFLLDESQQGLYLAGSVGFSEQYSSVLQRAKRGDSLTSKIAKESQAVFSEDISIDRRAINRNMEREGIRAYAGLPLRSRSELLGVMNVVCRSPRRFDSSDISLLNAVADQLAVAIDNTQLFEKSAHLAVVEERNWLAREIHDTLAQGLVALTLQIELALTQLTEEGDAAKAEKSLRKTLELARENLEEARRSVLELRGDRLTSLGLVNSITEVANEFAEDTGIKVNTVISPRLGVLPINLEEGLYRIAQEALSNVRKHAQAHTVQISLQRRDGHIRLTIRDDGEGFNPLAGPPPGHFGIQGMGERAGLLGGRLDVHSRPGHGTLVRAIVPLRRASPSGIPHSEVKA